MPIPFSTKLHILLIMIVIGFGLYMFLLFKEIRLFQDEIDDMRGTIDLIKTVLDVPSAAKAAKASNASNTSNTSNALNASNASNAIDGSVGSACNNASQVCVKSSAFDDDSAKQFEEEDDDDSASVTSLEIKNILTNIRNVDGDVVTAEVDEIVVAAATPSLIIAPPTEVVITSPQEATTVDISTLSLEKLQKVNYDDLRKHLRNLGHNIKGTKPELIKKIQEIHGNV